MTSPDKPKFQVLEGIEPKIAPLSMQTSHLRALERLRKNFANKPQRVEITPVEPDSIA